MCERELETEQNCNILKPTLLAITAFLSRSPVLLNRRSGGPAVCKVLFSLQHHFSNSSDPQNSFRGPEDLFCWVLVFSCLQLTDFLSSPSYIIVKSPTQYLPITGHRNMHFHRLWNGMFDRHRTEITIMQFTGHSLPVHQSVTVPWDFNPVPYCQPSSPTLMEYALPPSLEWHVWRGRRSIYNTYTPPKNWSCVTTSSWGRLGKSRYSS